MFKKFLSLALALMLVMSVAAVSFSAAQVEVAEEAAPADDVASQGAEAEVASQGAEADVAATGDGVIYFDAASAGWSGASAISFYIYEYGGGNVTEWGSKNKSLTSNDGDTWSFDAAGAGVVDGKEYGIIFNNLDTTAQTADLLFNTSCYGDTAYVPNPDDKLENTVDSNKKSMVARWKNSSLGPILGITSIGNIVGESIPSTTSAYKMMVNFLASKGSQSLTNALNFNGKDAQTTIDEVAAKLNLTQADVTKAIAEAASTGDGTDTTDWTGKWDASKSSLPAGSSSGSDSSSSSSSGSSSSSSGSTGTSGSSSSSSSTTKSGSASNTQTGQGETVLFIMLGVMVAAAGVIFFARKRERA